jgi:GxxExxY protein
MSQIDTDVSATTRTGEARDEQTHGIIGAAMEVHSELGHGFLEPVYQAAMQRELTRRAIPHRCQAEIPVLYKGEPLECSYRADFICYDAVIVELKALSVLSRAEYAQVINYLKGTGMKRALLLNFGAPRLEYKRFVR